MHRHSRHGGTRLNEPRPGEDPTITVVDLGLSNLSSVMNSLSRVRATAVVSADPARVGASRALVLPGVGAFADGMAALRERDLVEPINRHAATGRPLLGICLGMQLLASHGEEGGDSRGLGLVPGRAVRMAPRDAAVRVPNTGWCDVQRSSDGGPVAADGCFYFAHSYELIPDDPEDITAFHDVGGPIVSAVARGSTWGVQFHPEKSQDDGLAVLDAFHQEALAA